MVAVEILLNMLKYQLSLDPLYVRLQGARGVLVWNDEIGKWCPSYGCQGKHIQSSHSTRGYYDGLSNSWRDLISIEVKYSPRGHSGSVIVYRCLKRPVEMELGRYVAEDAKTLLGGKAYLFPLGCQHGLGEGLYLINKLLDVWLSRNARFNK